MNATAHAPAVDAGVPCPGGSGTHDRPEGAKQPAIKEVGGPVLAPKGADV